VTRRIGKRTREAAIHCLEQCASDRIGDVAYTATSEVYDAAAPNERLAEDTASDAWLEVNRIAYELSMADKYLEAAALLRDGWNPGDPVEVRR
jgi:hypothetical protein